MMMSEDLMFALVRNDDGHPAVLELFEDEGDAMYAKGWWTLNSPHFHGYFIREIDLEEDIATARKKLDNRLL